MMQEGSRNSKSNTTRTKPFEDRPDFPVLSSFSSLAVSRTELYLHQTKNNLRQTPSKSKAKVVKVPYLCGFWPLFYDFLVSSTTVSTCVETSELLSFLTRWFVETYQWITASPLYVFGIVNFWNNLLTSTYHFNDKLFRSHFQLPYSTWSKTMSQIKVLRFCILLKNP